MLFSHKPSTMACCLLTLVLNKKMLLKLFSIGTIYLILNIYIFDDNRTVLLYTTFKLPEQKGTCEPKSELPLCHDEDRKLRK